MKAQMVIWLIALPLVASPLVYLAGRLRLQIADCRLQIGRLAIRNVRSAIPSARLVGLGALVAAWAPFLLVVRDFAAFGPSAFTLGTLTFRLDGLSLLFAALALGLGTLVTLYAGLDTAGAGGEEKYYALLVTLVGMLIGLACAVDLFNLWLWFEAIAIVSYLLVAGSRAAPLALEASVKYLVQGAAGSTLALLGIALILGHTGTLNLDRIRLAADVSPALLAAGALLVVGFGVKAALAPLHAWLPDAYTQAPSGTSALFSGVVTKAGLIALLRALAALGGVTLSWGALLMGFGALNILVGNLFALRQTQVKRLLAYSSLSQLGYIMLGLGVGVHTGQSLGVQGGLFHLLTHGLMSAQAFLAAGGLLYALRGATPTDRRGDADQDALTITDLAGAAKRYPLPALALSLAALGMAGLPPLAGFMSKWQIFVAGFATHNSMIGALTLFAAVNSVLSLVYYAPLVNAVYRERTSAAVRAGRPLPIGIRAPLLGLALLVLVLGVWPGLAAWLTEPASTAVLAAFGGIR
jgi:proton-translocating NADH-quinone oxidoreductase chain N